MWYLALIIRMAFTVVNVIGLMSAFSNIMNGTGGYAGVCFWLIAIIFLSFYLNRNFKVLTKIISKIGNK